MITNEVAFVAIAVSDKERARKFYQETLAKCSRAMNILADAEMVDED